ncbi:MAG: DUF86 domain-containing protein [Candidatus Zixiibacteriota bacterium]|nr:MAG: DUF86 domain-containing protein [candidate division Zixibacteria bacterium]
MAGLRDTLVHDYFGIDKQRTWQTITVDLPDFRRNINRILSDD